MKGSNRIYLFVTVFVIVVVVGLTASFSYAYVIKARSFNNNIQIATGDFGSNLTFTSVNYNLTSLSDSDGMSQSNYGIIEINGTNNDYSTYYEIGLGYDTDAILSQGATATDLIPLEYVRIAIYAINGSTVSSSPVVGPVAITELPLLSIDTDNYLNDMYRVHWDYEDAGASRKFAIKFWLDQHTPVENNGKHIYLGSTVKQQAKREVNFYNLFFNDLNLNGSAYNGSGFFDGRPCSFVGLWTSPYLPEGVHTITVLNNGNRVTRSFVIEHVLSSSDIGISVISPTSASITSAGSPQSIAYTYGTTINQILDGNNYNSLSSSGTATIPGRLLIKDYAPLADETYFPIEVSVFDITTANNSISLGGS